MSEAAMSPAAEAKAEVQYETCIKVITVVDKKQMEAELAKIAEERWEQHPDYPVIAYYTLRRPKVQEGAKQGGMDATGKMIIDDSLVMIRDKDGNLRKF